MDKSIQYYQGQLVIKKTSITVIDDEGEEVVRTVRLLEDGSRVVQEKPVKNKNRRGRPTAIAERTAEEVPDVEVEAVPDVDYQSNPDYAPPEAAKESKTLPPHVVPYATGAPQPGGFQQNPQQYYYPNGGQPVVGQPNAGQPQVMYQVPYNEDKARCCGCTCAVFWAICCFTTIAIGLILWFVVIRRLFWWRNLRGLLDDDDNYYGYNWSHGVSCSIATKGRLPTHLLSEDTLGVYMTW
eukprot:Nitzschia sp. Nitz4//scaffold352_size16485//3051//3921//NITZ4_008855-RA/size16485-snap-gene-0.0-mRNA-1//1//CDS//3329548894//6047//frame0